MDVSEHNPAPLLNLGLSCCLLLGAHDTECLTVILLLGGFGRCLGTYCYLVVDNNVSESCCAVFQSARTPRHTDSDTHSTGRIP